MSALRAPFKKPAKLGRLWLLSLTGLTGPICARLAMCFRSKNRSPLGSIGMEVLGASKCGEWYSTAGGDFFLSPFCKTKKRPPYQRKILRTACHRPCTNSALRGLQRSPVAHIKALNALSNFLDPKTWIRILRYVLANFTQHSSPSVGVSE